MNVLSDKVVLSVHMDVLSDSAAFLDTHNKLSVMLHISVHMNEISDNAEYM